MNKQQLVDLIKGLLVVQGPVVIILVNLMGMEQDAAEKLAQGIGALVTIGGFVWLAVGRTNANMVLDAAQVKGTQIHVDTKIAPSEVVEIARDTHVPDVVPMVGGPRKDKPEEKA